jgi:hypothetical protein
VVAHALIRWALEVGAVGERRARAGEDHLARVYPHEDRRNPVAEDICRVVGVRPIAEPLTKSPTPVRSVGAASGMRERDNGRVNGTLLDMLTIHHVSIKIE